MSTTPILILLVSNLFIGMLIMWFFYRVTMSEGEKKIEKLRTSLKNKDAKLKDLKEETLEHESNIDGLQKTIAKKDKNISQISAQVKERDDSVSSLNRDLSDLRAKWDSLNVQLDKREEAISLLRDQNKEKDSAIELIREDLASFEKKTQNALTRAEAAEIGIAKLEEELEEKTLEVASQKLRIRSMQDDLSVIDGIGPKVSSLLRSAGITSFSKLAEREPEEIQGILLAENPSLTRLTDPSTWHEQARMAADGEWGGFRALQGSIKEERRTKDLLKREVQDTVSDATIVVQS